MSAGPVIRDDSVTRREPHHAESNVRLTGRAATTVGRVVLPVIVDVIISRPDATVFGRFHLRPYGVAFDVCRRVYVVRHFRCRGARSSTRKQRRNGVLRSVTGLYRSGVRRTSVRFPIAGNDKVGTA